MSSRGTSKRSIDTEESDRPLQREKREDGAAALQPDDEQGVAGLRPQDDDDDDEDEAGAVLTEIPTKTVRKRRARGGELSRLLSTGVSALDTCTQWASMQKGGTCYFAAVVNLLLCTAEFRHYLTRVLNAQRCAKPRGFYDQEYSEAMDFTDMLLHIFYKQTCKNKTFLKKRTFSENIDDRLVSMFFKDRAASRDTTGGSSELTQFKNDGGVSELVLAELLRTFGVTCAVPGQDFSTFANEDVLILNEDYGYAQNFSQNGITYTLVAGIGLLLFTEGESHCLTGLLCNEKRYLFDSNNAVLDIDWTLPTAEVSYLVCVSEVLYNMYIADGRKVLQDFKVSGVYLSQIFLQNNLRPVSCNSALTCKKDVKPLSLKITDFTVFPLRRVNDVVYEEAQNLKVAYPYLNVSVSNYSLTIKTEQQHFVAHYIPSKHEFATSFCNKCYDGGLCAIDYRIFPPFLLNMPNVLLEKDINVLHTICVDVLRVVGKGLCSHYYKNDETEPQFPEEIFVEITYTGVAFYIQHTIETDTQRIVQKKKELSLKLRWYNQKYQLVPAFYENVFDDTKTYPTLEIAIHAISKVDSEESAEESVTATAADVSDAVPAVDERTEHLQFSCTDVIHSMFATTNYLYVTPFKFQTFGFGQSSFIKSVFKLGLNQNLLVADVRKSDIADANMPTWTSLVQQAATYRSFDGEARGIIDFDNAEILSINKGKSIGNILTEEQLRLVKTFTVYVDHYRMDELFGVLLKNVRKEILKLIILPGLEASLSVKFKRMKLLVEDEAAAPSDLPAPDLLQIATSNASMHYSHVLHLLYLWKFDKDVRSVGISKENKDVTGDTFYQYLDFFKPFNTLHYSESFKTKSTTWETMSRWAEVKEMVQAVIGSSGVVNHVLQNFSTFSFEIQLFLPSDNVHAILSLAFEVLKSISTPEGHVPLRQIFYLPTLKLTLPFSTIEADSMSDAPWDPMSSACMEYVSQAFGMDKSSLKADVFSARLGGKRSRLKTQHHRIPLTRHRTPKRHRTPQRHKTPKRHRTPKRHITPRKHTFLNIFY